METILFFGQSTGKIGRKKIGTGSIKRKRKAKHARQNNIKKKERFL